MLTARDGRRRRKQDKKRLIIGEKTTQRHHLELQRHRLERQPTRETSDMQKHLTTVTTLRPLSNALVAGVAVVCRL